MSPDKVRNGNRGEQVDGKNRVVFLIKRFCRDKVVVFSGDIGMVSRNMAQMSVNSDTKCI